MAEKRDYAEKHLDEHVQASLRSKQELLDTIEQRALFIGGEVKTSKQLTLGELILKLEAIEEKSKPVIFDERYFPTGIDSWRGSYIELALEYAEVGEHLSVEEWLKRLQATVGATLYGYKGGEFLMGKTTPVWVANYGESSGFTRDGGIWTQAVVGVSQHEQAVIIETQNIEY